MAVGTERFYMLPVPILTSETILPTSVGKINFISLYKDGWIKTGTLPEPKFDIFFSSCATRSTILILRNALFASSRYSHVLSLVLI